MSACAMMATTAFFSPAAWRPPLQTADDIVEVDYDGTVHDAAGRRSYPERFIHRRDLARPDVMAIDAQPFAGDDPVWRHPRHVAAWCT